MPALRRIFCTLSWCVVVIVCASVTGVFAAELQDVPSPKGNYDDETNNIVHPGHDHRHVPPPKGNYNDETLCVEPVEIMRRRHFDFILDHRDRTVIQGIRTKQYSLIGCIDCHITPDEQGKYARYSEDTHFCASCHQFAAVTIDCFQCHADRPKEAIRKAVKLE